MFLEPEECNVGEDDNSHTVNDIEIINVQQALEVSSVAIDEASEESEDDDDSQIQSATVKLVLQQKRCANHTLNLVASVDSMFARDNSVKYKRSYDRAMGKVQALSNAVQRSTKNADEVEDTIGLTFLNPTITRWNSSYFAVKRIVEVGIDGVIACQNKIGLEVFSDDDMQFLKAYVEVMKPLALAMDKL